jgi:predicted pyridoxine 5'-phosphate oxidase superfamily flavin-nucleotide-binding protein
MLPRHTVELLQTGVSVVVGTRDASLTPECTRAWGIRVETDGASVTIFLAETIAQKTLENLRENGMLAVSCTRPTDHLACQLKGRARNIRAIKTADREASQRWRRDFLAELTAIGVPSELTQAWIVEPTLAVEMDVTDVFEQTPGPGAGVKVTP